MKKTRPITAVLTSLLIISAASVSVLADPPGATKCTPYPMCAIYGSPIVQPGSQTPKKVEKAEKTTPNKIGKTQKH